MRRPRSFIYFEMHNSENQLALAELKFSYTVYPQLLKLSNTQQANEMLLKLWEQECQCKEQKRYVLFLDYEEQFITWKHLPNSLNIAHEIAGMALACNAKGIIISHNRLNYPKPNFADKTLVTKTFRICECMMIEILDYLIITPNQCVSYKASIL